MALAELPPSLGPQRKLQISQVFFGTSFQAGDAGVLLDYFQYFSEEIALLQYGTSPHASQAANLAISTYDDILAVARIIQDNNKMVRSQLREKLRLLFPGADGLALDRSLDVVVRLWLMVNTKEFAFQSLRPQTRSLQWADNLTLRSVLHRCFPEPRWKVTAKESRLDPYFTAVNMVEICRLRILWTTSLHEHLFLDRRNKILKIFPYKGVVQAMLSELNQRPETEDIIPRAVLAETIWSLDLLFPPWDRRTDSFLEKERQSFHQIGSFDDSRTLSLSDFHYWSDRLLEVYEEVFKSPPVSWAQLWRDRRNPQQFWTFWIALVILALTVVSCVTGIVQAWASIQALGRS